MSLRALLLVLPMALSGPAWAECLTAAALKSGIAVTVKDKSVQIFRAAGGAVQARFAVLHNGNGFEAEQKLGGGFWVQADHRTYREAPADEGVMIVGGNDGGTRDDRFRATKAPALPQPGQTVSVTLTLSRDEDGPSIGPQPRVSGSAVATVTGLDEKQVTLSGCSYRIWPIETRIDAKPDAFGADSEAGTLLTRRQIWFPDLGFAVTTKEVGSASGWGDDWGQGIVALAPAG